METALFSVVKVIEDQLELKGVHSSLSGCRRSVQSRKGAGEHCIPESIIDWITSSLESRELTTSWMGQSIGGRVSEGCPQGGVLSPLLWSLVVDSLLRVLNGMGVKAVGYADDIAILARGAYEEVLRDVVQGALKATEEWCSQSIANSRG